MIDDYREHEQKKVFTVCGERELNDFVGYRIGNFSRFILSKSKQRQD